MYGFMLVLGSSISPYIDAGVFEGTFIEFLLDFLGTLYYNPPGFLHKKVPWTRIRWLDLIIFLGTFEILRHCLEFFFFLLKQAVLFPIGLIRDILSTLFSNGVDLIKDLTRAFIIFCGSRLWDLIVWICKLIFNSGFIRDILSDFYHFIIDVLRDFWYLLLDLIDRIKR